MSESTTPLMQQYHAIKSRYPHALLLFRLGDFYELFYEDALLASRELQITLTSRNREKGQPIPMCGVPYHAADSYVARLIRAGFKIATGEFQATEFSGPRAEEDLRDEMQLLHPRETLLPRPQQLFETSRTSLLDGTGGVESHLEDWAFQYDYAKRILREQFGVAELASFGLDGHSQAVAASGAIVHYLRENAARRGETPGGSTNGDATCSLQALRHLDSVRYYQQHDALVLDPVTVRNLELIQPIFTEESARSGPTTLLSSLDVTITGMGARLLRSWILRPL